MFYGRGAGQMPTASAVVADIIDTAVGRTAITFRTLELWSNRKARVTPREHAKADGRFYLRVNAEDHPGVLAQVANVLGQHDISISSVLQQEIASPDDTVPLVIMTHETTEGATRKACAEINKLTCVRGKTVRMWVRD
jgi:homoserine dehydrogenase